MAFKIIQVNPVIDNSVRGLCVKAYPGHKKGCPNYNHKNGCPPKSKIFTDVYDFDQPIYAIVNRFDLDEHRSRMRTLHPSWSQRQLDCCLYWQPKARKDLWKGIINFIKEHPEYWVTACPEAMGIEVTKTLEAVSINLEWPPDKYSYQVALAGKPKRLGNKASCVVFDELHEYNGKT